MNFYEFTLRILLVLLALITLSASFTFAKQGNERPAIVALAIMLSLCYLAAYGALI